MKIIGLTGGIASGKSSVSRLLSAEHGIPIVDLDIIARQALVPGTFAFRKVVAIFGPAILSGGAIHRKRLGEVVFNDRSLRQKLNQVLQPWIALRLLWALIYEFSLGSAVVVVDAPLLFETGLHRLCSVVVVVSVDPQTQLQRLMTRDGAGEADARARIAAQPLSLEAKAARADLVVDNRGAPHETRETVGRTLPATLPIATPLHPGPSSRRLDRPRLALALDRCGGCSPRCAAAASLSVHCVAPCCCCCSRRCCCARAPPPCPRRSGGATRRWAQAGRRCCSERRRSSSGRSARPSRREVHSAPSCSPRPRAA
jgi:dephospho-CoA kinase